MAAFKRKFVYTTLVEGLGLLLQDIASLALHFGGGFVYMLV